MATSGEWHAARTELEAQLTALLRGSEPLEPRLSSLLRSLFPELAAEAGGAGAEAEEGAEKRDSWEKQLVEHCFFRVLGACVGGCHAGAGPRRACGRPVSNPARPLVHQTA